MKRLLLPLIAAIALPNILNVLYVAPIYALPWDKRKPDYSNQEDALDACFDFAKKVLENRVRDPRKQTYEEIIADQSVYEFGDPLPSPFKNELGDYKILNYGCKRVSKKNSNKIIPEFRAYIQYLKIPANKGDDFKVEELTPTYYEENGKIIYPKFGYEPKESDRPTGGLFDQYGYDQDFIVGLGFGMAYRLCRETFLHKTLTKDDLEKRKALDKKFLREFPDAFANQKYPKQVIELTLKIYEGRLAKCVQEGDGGNWFK